MKAKTNKVVRAIARCNDCGWVDGFKEKGESLNPVDRLRISITAHVREFGHTVTLETCYQRAYVPTDGFNSKINHLRD